MKWKRKWRSGLGVGVGGVIGRTNAMALQRIRVDSLCNKLGTFDAFANPAAAPPPVVAGYGKVFG